MLSSQEEQEERRRVFAPDQSLPNQASTFHQRAVADAAMPRGRFSAVEAATVVGANPTIDYPAGPAWSADPGAQCVEPSNTRGLRTNSGSLAIFAAIVR